jgi:hypothetical protein
MVSVSIFTAVASESALLPPGQVLSLLGILPHPRVDPEASRSSVCPMTETVLTATNDNLRRWPRDKYG